MSQEDADQVMTELETFRDAALQTFGQETEFDKTENDELPDDKEDAAAE